MTNMHTFARLRRSLALSLGLMLSIGVAHAADTVTYYHTDALGTPVMESDTAGTVTYAREHKPYGEQALGVAKHGPGFTGHIMDADTGLIYMQARYFDPIASRFMSNDPVAADLNNGVNYNRYWYANNNPFAFTDPDGRKAFSGHLCDMGCDAGSFIADGGGGGGRDSEREEVEGEVRYQSFNDLPKLPIGMSSPDGQTYSGEGWERVERYTGKQEVIWNPISESQWSELPISIITSFFKSTSLAGRIVVPDIQYARQSGYWASEYQIGYKHIFSHKENGIFQENREIFMGYDTIWTSQKYWRKNINKVRVRYQLRPKL